MMNTFDRQIAGNPNTHRMPVDLVDALEQAKSIDRVGLAFVRDDLSTHELTWRQVATEAERRGARLLQLGLTRGQRIGMFAHEEEPFALTFFGAVLAGLVPVPMSPPSPMGSTELQLQRISGILTSSGAAGLVGPADLGATLQALRTSCPTLKSHATYEQLAEAGDSSDVLSAIVRPSRDDLCFLQFTSGSTRQPKGVEVTHGNIVANTEARHQLMGTNIERRVGVSWAPLFHDMGLVGSLVPAVLFHCRHVFIPTMTFVRKPQVWLETIHRHRATITTANNYALRAAMRRLSKDSSLDLSCLEALIVSGEPIHPDVVRSFIAAVRPYGLSDTALSPAYGMAEATLVVSIARRADRFTTLAIARDAYEREGQVRMAGSGESALQVVDCGLPLPGHEVSIVDTESNPLPEDRVGEILFRGPSVCRGYYEDREATNAVFQNGWLRTGDLGFVHAGHVYVSGRVKDLIIIAGRNHYPQDIEWTVSQLAGVRSYHVIAFSVPGPEGEQLIVVCEGARDQELDGLDRRIRELIVREFGVQPSDIVIAEPGALPQTSSGKPRRRQAREDYLNGRFGRRSASGTETTG